MSINQKWLDGLKMAVINEDITDIIKHTSDIPKLETLEESQTLLALIQRAKELINAEMRKIDTEMTQIKQTKKYLS